MKFPPPPPPPPFDGKWHLVANCLRWQIVGGKLLAANCWWLIAGGELTYTRCTVILSWYH